MGTLKPTSIPIGVTVFFKEHRQVAPTTQLLEELITIGVVNVSKI